MSRFPIRPTRVTGVAAVLVAMLALAGCTSSSSSPSTTGSAAASSHELTAITPIPGTPSGSTPVSSPPEPPLTKPPPSTTKSTPPGLATCTSAQLAVRVLRGGAVAGQEIALITFTNTSATRCAMFGYPGVSLRLHTVLLGNPAQRSVKKPTSVSLAPNAAAESTITDISSCQAPVSDTVRIYAPDQTAFVDKPLELRGCRLFIDPVRPSS